ncbi:MAG: amidohydrolase family protein [Steroidobacteraceae bacterium]
MSSVEAKQTSGAQESTLFVSADAHVVEPADLWTSRLPQKFRDRALRLDHHGNFVDTILPGLVNVTSRKTKHIDGKYFDDTDTLESRQRDLDADGVWGEVIYPNYALALFMPDHEMCMAHARVYNDYIVETFGQQLDRRAPVALIPLTDVDDAVAEIERVAKCGLRAINVPSMPPRPYSTDAYERVWAAAQAQGMVVTIHVGTGFEAGKSTIGEVFASMTGAHAGGIETPIARRLIEYHGAQVAAERALIGLIGSGVMERYPRLHFVMVEFDAHWLSAMIATMEQCFGPFTGADIEQEIGEYDHSRPEHDQPRMNKIYAVKWPYPLRPGDYVRRQVHATFMHDPSALALRHVMGTEAILWGNDYPHNEGTWPNSRKVTQELFAGIPASERAAILGGTTAKLFGLKPPLVARAEL